MGKIIKLILGNNTFKKSIVGIQPFFSIINVYMNIDMLNGIDDIFDTKIHLMIHDITPTLYRLIKYRLV